MPVCYERGGVVVFGSRGAGGRQQWRQGQEIAAAGGAGGDEGEDFGEEALLHCCVLETH